MKTLYLQHLVAVVPLLLIFLDECQGQTSMVSELLEQTTIPLETCRSCCQNLKDLKFWVGDQSTGKCNNEGCNSMSCGGFACQTGLNFRIGLPSAFQTDANGVYIAYACNLDGTVTSLAPTAAPTTSPPTTKFPTPFPTPTPPTAPPSTANPTPLPTTAEPTPQPSTAIPTPQPTTGFPTPAPVTLSPATLSPTKSPIHQPTSAPTTKTPTVKPTVSPTPVPTTSSPTRSPVTGAPTSNSTPGYTDDKPPKSRVAEFFSDTVNLAASIGGLAGLILLGLLCLVIQMTPNTRQRRRNLEWKEVDYKKKKPKYRKYTTDFSKDNFHVSLRGPWTVTKNVFSSDSEVRILMKDRPEESRNSMPLALAPRPSELDKSFRLSEQVASFRINEDLKDEDEIWKFRDKSVTDSQSDATSI